MVKPTFHYWFCLIDSNSQVSVVLLPSVSSVPINVNRVSKKCVDACSIFVIFLCTKKKSYDGGLSACRHPGLVFVKDASLFPLAFPFTSPQTASAAAEQSEASLCR